MGSSTSSPNISSFMRARRVAWATPIWSRATTSNATTPWPPALSAIAGSVSFVPLLAAKRKGSESPNSTLIATCPATGELLKTVNGTENVSPGVAKRGQLLCTSSGERTSTGTSADPKRFSSDATAMMRSWPVNCGSEKSACAKPCESDLRPAAYRFTGLGACGFFAAAVYRPASHHGGGVGGKAFRVGGCAGAGALAAAGAKQLAALRHAGDTF